MSGRYTRHVRLEPSPEAQAYGDLAQLRGRTARDIFTLAQRGLEVTMRVAASDGISVPDRIKQGLCALEQAGNYATAVPTDVSVFADVRGSATSSEWGQGEVVAIEEVARMCERGVRQTRRLAIEHPGLGGRKTSRGWRFDRDIAQRYIDTHLYPLFEETP